MIIWIVISVIFVAVDQIIKYLVVQNISPTEIVEAIPRVLNLVYVENTGAAFSILSGKVYILGIVSIVVCFAMVWYLVTKKPKNKLLLVSLGMILGGAAGNLIDRVFRGYVIDFLEPAFMNFPVFNIADIAINVGAVLLIIYVIVFDGKEKK